VLETEKDPEIRDENEVFFSKIFKTFFNIIFGEIIFKLKVYRYWCR
jgi:hypothetical protein